MNEHRTKVGLVTATAIVVANMVGTGIFGSLGYQVAALPSGFPILLLWLVGGVVSCCGAVCYAELASMFPRSGGEYQLLGHCWPQPVAFLAGWISVAAGFTAPVALNAALLGDYLAAITGGGTLWFSIPALLAVTAIHLGQVRLIASFQSIFTYSKIFLIFFLGLLGFVAGTSQRLSFLPQPGDAQLIASPGFAISLVYVLYAYAGWNAATYMMDEIRDARRIVPRAILIGSALVTLLYLWVNAAFLYATPLQSLSGEPESGLVAARAILGRGRGDLAGLLIAFGLISTISSMTWAGPRVAAAAGRDYPLLAPFARLNRNGVPSFAILVQSSVALLFLITATFEQIIQYVQALLTLSSLAVVTAMMWLRWKNPDAPRPYRAWGYPVTPVIFLTVSGGVLCFQVYERPVECIWGLATLVIGLALYARSKKHPEVK